MPIAKKVKLLRDITIYGKKFPTGSVLRLSDQQNPYFLVEIDGKIHRFKIGKDAAAV